MARVPGLVDDRVAQYYYVTGDARAKARSTSGSAGSSSTTSWGERRYAIPSTGLVGRPGAASASLHTAGKGWNADHVKIA
jgi:hypothetical protein